MKYLELFLSNYNKFILNGLEPTLYTQNWAITKPAHYEQKYV